MYRLYFYFFVYNKGININSLESFMIRVGGRGLRKNKYLSL